MPRCVVAFASRPRRALSGQSVFEFYIDAARRARHHPAVLDTI